MRYAFCHLARARVAAALLALTMAIPVPRFARAAADPLSDTPRDIAVARTDSAVAHADTTIAPAEKPFLSLTYADSMTSVNTHCIVSGSHLNPRVAPVYVNGEPVGFC